MDSDIMDDSAFNDFDDESDGYAPEVKPKAKAPAKKAAAPKAKAAAKKTTQTKLNIKPATKKRPKPESEDEGGSDGEVSDLSRTPPSAKKQKKAPVKKSGGKPLAEIENDSIIQLDSSPDKPKAKKKTATETYAKLTQLEHIIKRPDTYIGSVERTDSEMWVFDKSTNMMVKKKVSYVPGLYKIFDEILVNAADNKQRDKKKMTYLKITIDRAAGEISVENNGKGIPVEMHNKENVYVPELIFGHLLAGSNFDDDEKKTVGGRNGYGAKLCNVFSTEFHLECQDSSNGKRYKQTWRNNMSKMEKAKITSSKNSDFTRVTFKPDFAKFGMPDGIDDDLEALLYRRVYDMAGTVAGIKVYLNDEVLNLTFEKYCEMYAKAIAKDRGDVPTDDESQPVAKVIFEAKTAHERWQIGFTVSDGSFQQVSFVNSIATTSGGTHVNYIADQICNALLKDLGKKMKGHLLKLNHVRNHIFIFVNCFIENPTFNSQTKEQMTLKATAFGSRCSLSERFIKLVKATEAIENILHFAEKKADKAMAKSDGSKRARISNDKLVDANLAGTKHGHECTLILTEGDSAKGLAVAGRAIRDPDRLGVFPLRGKLLNVRDATTDQIMKNKEIENIKKFLGLKHKQVYTDTKSLRYGHLMIMADQDHDGSHIKGLLINFLQVQFPSLLKIPGFFQEFTTPVVKVWQGPNPKKPLRLKSFFTLPQYEEWKETNKADIKKWKCKYFKGLGTSTTADAQVYFTQIDDHQKEFDIMRPEEADLFELAFSKKKADARKDWLGNFVPGTYLDHTMQKITHADFINKELILFSMADNMRSIPSVLDGLKPGQRKVLFACFKRNLINDQKVVELAGYVSEQTAYHHGEQSLQQTIVSLAQDFVGSNNVNILEPSGNFGTRFAGGSDAASARYIFTRLSPFARRVFSSMDEPNLDPQYEDGKKIEPKVYLPVIPMVLVNGADGIGTGWSTQIPNYNPEDIIKNLKRRMGRLDDDDDEEKPFETMTPWFRGWKGNVSTDEAPAKYKFEGIAETNEDRPNEVIISELPIRSWTDSYKAWLETVIQGEKSPSWIKDYKEYNDHRQVRFEIQLDDKHMAAAHNDGLIERFKLSKAVNTTNIVAFDATGRIRKYEKVEDILEEYYGVRMNAYTERKNHWLNVYHADYRKLKNQYRFIQEIIDNKLVVSKKKKAVLVQELRDRKYEAFPPGEDKKKSTDEEMGQDDAEDDSDGSARDFDYLLSMPIWSLTLERLEKLKKQIAERKAQHDELESKSEKDLWCQDLDDFVLEWENQKKIDAEIQTNIRRLSRGAAKKGRGRAKKTAADDDYEQKKPARAPKKEPKIVEKLVEKPAKTHAIFEKLLAKKHQPAPALKSAASFDGSVDLSDDDFDMLKSSKVKTETSQEKKPSPEASETVTNGRNKRAAATKAKTWVIDDDSSLVEDDDDDQMLGDVGAMVKGIGKPAGDSNSGRLSLHPMSLPDGGFGDGASVLPKSRVTNKPSKTFDFDSQDDTNYEALALSSPRKSTKAADEVDDFLSDDDMPAPKAAVAITKTSSSLTASKPASAAPAAKSRGRPAALKNKPAAEKAAPPTKATKTTAAKPAKVETKTKQPTLSPAAKAYALKKAKASRNIISDDEDDEMPDAAESEPDSPLPKARGRPARAAVAKAKKPVYIDSEDDEDDSVVAADDDDDDDEEEQEQESNNFEMSDSF